MNPGPFGMVQTGVPFGDVAMVRGWLGIEAPVERPGREHPKRPVRGFEIGRGEVSGARFWGWAQARFGTPERFFQSAFVWNYCPLAFVGATGRNLTPDTLPRSEREPAVRRVRRRAGRGGGAPALHAGRRHRPVRGPPRRSPSPRPRERVAGRRPTPAPPAPPRTAAGPASSTMPSAIWGSAPRPPHPPCRVRGEPRPLAWESHGDPRAMRGRSSCDESLSDGSLHGRRRKGSPSASDNANRRSSRAVAAPAAAPPSRPRCEAERARYAGYSGRTNTNRLLPALGRSSGVRRVKPDAVPAVPVLTATYCRPSTA